MARARFDFPPLALDEIACRLLAPGAGPMEPPIRSVIFGASRLCDHGRSLARAQEIAAPGERRTSFFPRLQENLAVLRDSRAVLEEHARQGHPLAPAADWLIDNGALLEFQLETVRKNLPRRYFEKLPRLRAQALAGLPRVYGLAWDWVAHTDSGLDEELLELYLAAYQSQSKLTLAELWAIPTTLRVVLIENLRRLAERAATLQSARDAAQRWLDRPAVQRQSGLLDRLGDALRSRGAFDAFALQLLRCRDDWPAAAAAELRAWLAAQLADPAAALQREQQEAAEDHQSVRNAMTSLRNLDHVDWRGILMRSNAGLARLQQLSVFAAEAEATQDLALHEIEKLARRAGVAESRVSAALVQLAGPACGRASAPLHWLRGAGRPELLRTLGLPRRERLAWLLAGCRRAGTPAYLATLALGTGGLVATLLHRGAAPDLAAWAWALGAFLLFWPASEAVVAIVNRLISESVPPRQLPRLSLEAGIPIAQRPLVVMPVMLTSDAATQALAQQLEQHHLANPEPHAQFALLSDWTDAASESAAGDAALLAATRAALESLNRRYPATAGGPARFLLLHRKRRWSPSEQCWIGWERKRGKLEQLIAWLASGGESPFLDLGPLSAPAPAIRSVVTLDGDTDMPPGRLRELVAIAAHPLNVPVVDPITRRVSAGCAILQPRVAVPLPAPGEATPFHWLFSGQWGIDTYSAASSEIYEDLFAEGTYTGKGLLDVAAVHAVLGQRLPEAQVLSHDLLEGALARCALVSDVTLVEDAPSHPDVAASRLHRWTRGDWQLLPFLLHPRRWPMAGINRWKMFDNLRRSLVAPMSLMLLLWALAGAALLPVASTLGLVLAAYAAGPLLGAMAALPPRSDDLDLRLFFGRTLVEVARALLGAIWHLAQLLSQSLLLLDAVVRALLRQFHSRRHLLQWTTAAAAQAAARRDLPGLLRCHARVPLAAATLLALLVGARALGQPMDTAWAVALCAIWAAAPLWTWLASRSLAAADESLDDASRERVRTLAVDTWRYFARHVGEADNHLPPDNVQTTPAAPMVAHRTSPTNIGLYLLATAAARELGLLGTGEMVERLRRTLDTLDRLPRWRGHFYNWYDTRSLAVLPPAYVSAVDSGNSSGHLLVLAAACTALAEQVRRDGPQRNAVAASARRLRPLAAAMAGSTGLAALARLEPPAADFGVDSGGIARLRSQLRQARRELDALMPTRAGVEMAPLMRPLSDHIALLQAWLDDHDADAAASRAQLLRLAERARNLALAADFRALYDPRRRLLHIGYAVASGRPDASHYDLLASEARLASLVAIAKGDLPPRHWSALGRPLFGAAGVGASGVGLKSWSGSMFEYLMPTLVLAEPAGSMLFQATRAAVAAQRRDARRRGLPWGVSESAFAVQDQTLAYQYGPQGVADLALRRTPPDACVVAPYASVMALLVAPRAAAENLARLEALGARRDLGFIEALDYTAGRRGAGAPLPYVAVETFMAHHQAMSLLACAHSLTGGAVQRWAASEPLLRAVLPLLHERAPCEVPRLRRQREAMVPAPSSPRQRWQFECELHRAPQGPLHLLGNARHAVALRADGAGFSRWQGARDHALRDLRGRFAYIRRAADRPWVSLSAQPAPDEAASYRAEFHPDRVLLHARWHDLATTTTVAVSGRDLRLDLDAWVAWLHLNALLVDPATRAPGTGTDRHPLRRHGIDGERPILALWVESADGIARARQAASMLALWSAAGLALDLVVIDAVPASSQAQVQPAFATLTDMAALGIDPRLPQQRRARLILLRASELPATDQATLRRQANIWLPVDGRPLAAQIECLLCDPAEQQVQSRRQAVGTNAPHAGAATAELRPEFCSRAMVDNPAASAAGGRRRSVC